MTVASDMKLMEKRTFVRVKPNWPIRVDHFVQDLLHVGSKHEKSNYHTFSDIQRS
jgi:hypothetical protein